MIIASEIAGSSRATRPVEPVMRVARSLGATNAGQPSGSDRRWIAAILGRPLFDRARRPPSGTVSSAGALRLSGVIIGPFGRQAIFEPAGGGKPVVVHEGDRVGDSIVRSIGPDLVLVVGGSGVRALRPSYSGAVGATTATTRALRPRSPSLAARLGQAK